MPKYRVLVSRIRTRAITVEVDADNKKQAMQLAQSKASNEDKKFDAVQGYSSKFESIYASEIE